MTSSSSRWIGMAVLATMGLTACTTRGPADVGSAPSRTEPTEAAAPADAPVPTFVPAPSASVVAPARRGGAESSEGTTGTEQRDGKARLPFQADTRPDVSTTVQGFPVLVEVAKGRHPGYVRYVFEFVDVDPESQRPVGPARPAWDMRYIRSGEAVLDGSGEPAGVGGNVALSIGFRGTSLQRDADGQQALRRSVQTDDPLRLGGDFEGHVTWFLGLEQERPFRAFFAGPSKVVVDVVVSGQ